MSAVRSVTADRDMATDLAGMAATVPLSVIQGFMSRRTKIILSAAAAAGLAFGVYGTLTNKRGVALTGLVTSGIAGVALYGHQAIDLMMAKD